MVPSKRHYGSRRTQREPNAHGLQMNSSKIALLRQWIQALKKLGNARIQLVCMMTICSCLVHICSPGCICLRGMNTLSYRIPLSLWMDNGPWISSNSIFSSSPRDPVCISMPYLLSAALKTELFIFSKGFSGTHNVVSKSFSNINDICLHNMPVRWYDV